MEFSQLLTKLVRREDLTEPEVAFAVEYIASRKATENPVAVGVLLALLAAKGETADEIAAFAKHMRAHSVNVQLPVRFTVAQSFQVLWVVSNVCWLRGEQVGRPMLGIVGTSGDGDGTNTVNLSTASAILAASCGALVAKHGNRSVSSKAGSADVLEALGVPMLLPQNVAPCLEQAQITFLFRPNFHPAIRHVAPVRGAMGIRSVSNILGPLLNPAGCKRVVIGVYTPGLLLSFGEVLLRLGVEHGLVVHCAGLDELNSIGPADVVEIQQGIGTPLKCYKLHPKDVGVPPVTLKELQGGDATANAVILRKVLGGGVASDSPVGNTIAYNAGAGLYVYGMVDTIKCGYEVAKKQLESGKALDILENWAQVAQQLHKQAQERIYK
ncbi:hypothetical protein BBJ29_009965 [Phytophthora kernoviae]|uniref:Glycosyl transferase family 3 domain-containing protein n=1 Tax=Phytophthora kernoviae TaxID=325452 RepID=A0A3F2RB09_9STRA|nr:hypothetical protein BBJ29_009965 [Phytophthora kernoviae]RLN50776.1 hypothetical protein BBP00_00009999 [Phytophthora kernoviae]